MSFIHLPVLVLRPDFVLGGVLPPGVLDLEGRVVVRVGDGDSRDGMKLRKWKQDKISQKCTGNRIYTINLHTYIVDAVVSY